jgi:hypothetical protein
MCDYRRGMDWLMDLLTSFYFLGVGWDWVHLVRRPLIGLLYQLRMIDDEYGVVGGMRIARGNWSTRRKSAPVPLCSPKIPYDLIWARNRAAAVGSRRLTAWAMARPLSTYTHDSELQVVTALSLISTHYKSPQHPLSILPVCCVISHSLATASSSGDSSALHAQVLPSRSLVQNSSQLTLSWQLTFCKLTINN